MNYTLCDIAYMLNIQSYRNTNKIHISFK